MLRHIAIALMLAGCSAPAASPVAYATPERPPAAPPAPAGPVHVEACPAPGADMTEACVRSRLGLSGSALSIASVTSDLGKPFASGDSIHIQLEFDVLRGGDQCSAVEIIKTPNGDAVFHELATPPNDCVASVTAMRADLERAQAEVAGEPMTDMVIGVVVDAMDQQPSSGSLPYAAWRYLNADGV